MDKTWICSRKYHSFSISGFSRISIFFHFFSDGIKYPFSYFWPRCPQISIFCDFRPPCPHHISLSPVSRHWSMFCMPGLSQMFSYFFANALPGMNIFKQSICSNSKVYDDGRAQQTINGYQEWILVSKKRILRVLQVCQVSLWSHSNRGQRHETNSWAW